MVYEIKCSQCGKLIDFGGEEKDRLPENAYEFNGDIYCRECVKEFVEFGTGELNERIESLEDDMEEVKKGMGMEE
ncbi:MAG: hypothetical protein ABEJ98_00935 [Candidatus Nanohaloarchaea archaeon]